MHKSLEESHEDAACYESTLLNGPNYFSAYKTGFVGRG
jgi:hypothetical protein